MWSFWTRNSASGSGGMCAIFCRLEVRLFKALRLCLAVMGRDGEKFTDGKYMSEFGNFFLTTLTIFLQFGIVVFCLLSRSLMPILMMRVFGLCQSSG